MDPSRRTFAVGAGALGVLALVASPRLLSRPKPKVARVGVIFNAPPLGDFEPKLTNPNALYFREQLIKLGWIPGSNLELLWRTWEGVRPRIASTIEDLLKRPVDVLVVFGNSVIEEARGQTRAVPIVMGASTDVVAAGLVASLARPGGNITGLTTGSATELFGKRVALLRELIPNLARIAYITSNRAGGDEEMAALLRKLDVTWIRYRVARAQEVDAVLVDAKSRRVQAALLDDSAIFSNPEPKALIHAYAQKHRIPLMQAWLFGEGQGFMAYASHGVNFIRVASYVDRILKGTKPGDLPVEQPTNYGLLVNLNAARELGLVVPPSILAQAERVYD